MRFLPFVLGGLLAGAALPARAQTPADTPPAPRFYVGLGAYSSYYQPLGGRPYSGVSVPVQLTAGWQLRPRLAVQVGVAYSGISDNYAYSTTSYTAAGVPTGSYDVAGTNTERRATATALARYTLTRKPAHRLQIDLLGGLTLEHLSFHGRGTRLESFQPTPVVAPYDYRFADTSLLLTLGAGLRYRLTQRFELTYDLTFSRAVASDTPSLYTNLTSASALGLRYRFGR